MKKYKIIGQREGKKTSDWDSEVVNEGFNKSEMCTYSREPLLKGQAISIASTNLEYPLLIKNFIFALP